MALIKWLLKLKMNANTFFLILLCMKIRYEILFFLYIFFERIDRMHKNKIFFLFFHIYIYCNILEKIRYFNTRFVFLQYKNTNQY